MLDGLGVEYDQNDVNQFGLFREKLIEGVTKKSEGGGGSSDFSTAEVTYRLTFNVFEEAATNVQFVTPISVVNNELRAQAFVPVEEISQGSTSVDIKCSTPLYKNKITVDLSRISLGNEYIFYVYAGDTITASGNATITDEVLANITGDCVITIPIEIQE